MLQQRCSHRFGPGSAAAWRSMSSGDAAGPHAARTVSELGNKKRLCATDEIPLQWLRQMQTCHGNHTCSVAGSQQVIAPRYRPSQSSFLPCFHTIHQLWPRASSGPLCHGNVRHHVQLVQRPRVCGGLRSTFAAATSKNAQISWCGLRAFQIKLLFPGIPPRNFLET